MRFCSRCGFQLNGVGLLLQNDGIMPVSQSARNPGRRKQIIKESALLTAASWAVALVALSMWDWGGSIEIVAKVGSLIFFLLGLIGLLRFIYGFLFVRGDSTPSKPSFSTETRRAALPSPQEVPLTDYPQRTNTREMVPRGSIADQTTRLLDEK